MHQTAQVHQTAQIHQKKVLLFRAGEGPATSDRDAMNGWALPSMQELDVLARIRITSELDDE